MRRLDPSPATRRRAFWLAAVAAALLLAWLSRYDRDLPSPDGRGIVALELAGSGASAERLLCTWRQTPVSAGPAGEGGAPTAVTALDRAASSLRLDFLFLLLYPLAIGLGCLWVADALERQGAIRPAVGGRLLRGLAWAQVATGALDLVENLALVTVIARFRAGEPVGDALPLLARWCALPKFLLAAAGLGAVLVGLAVRAVGRRPRADRVTARPVPAGPATVRPAADRPPGGGRGG